MTVELGNELPDHVVAKIEKVLGIPPSELAEYGMAKLIEDLCDTALMFDREDRREDGPDDHASHPQRLPPPRIDPEADH